MVDWKKKIIKTVGDDLQADEQLEAGVFVQPAGALGRSLGSQLGGIGALVAVTRNQEKKRDAIKPKGLDLDIPLDDLVSISHEKGKIVTKMVFEFSDGSGAIMEASNISNPNEFIEAYQRLAR